MSVRDTPTRRRAVFFDRDGTINRDVHYLRDPAQLELLPGAADAIARVRAAGWLAIVITNQSGVARGFFSEADLDRIHARFRVLLAERGADIDGMYYCPHHPEGAIEAYRSACACRKPGAELFLRAANEHGIDLGRSVCVGDKERDVEAGLRAGCCAGYLLAAPGSPQAWATQATAVVSSIHALVFGEMGL